MAEQTIDCPKCGKKIPISSALTAKVEEQVREELKKENEKALKAKENEYEEKLEKAKTRIAEEKDEEIEALKDKVEKNKGRC